MRKVLTDKKKLTNISKVRSRALSCQRANKKSVASKLHQTVLNICPCSESIKNPDFRYISHTATMLQVTEQLDVHDGFALERSSFSMKALYRLELSFCSIPLLYKVISVRSLRRKCVYLNTCWKELIYNQLLFQSRNLKILLLLSYNSVKAVIPF